MQSKLRNSLLALTAVLAFVVGGAFFGEPLVPTYATGPQAAVVQDAAASQMSPEARIVFALLNATVSVAQAQSEIEAAAEAPADAAPAAETASRPATRVRHGRRSLGMPYFSFASVLPRAPRES